MRKKVYSNKETEQIALHLMRNYSLKGEASGRSPKGLQEYVTNLYKKKNYPAIFAGMDSLENVRWEEIAPIRWSKK